MALPSMSFHKPFYWDQVDQKLASLMLSELATEFHELLHEDEAQIHFQNMGSGNERAALSQRLEMQLLRSDEFADRQYELYCQAWQNQQEVLCPDFLRGICKQAIRILISARVNAVKGTLGLEQMRTRRHNAEWLKAVTGSFSRNMELLYGQWERAAEIDAKTLEYMRVGITSNPAVHQVAAEVIQARTRLRITEASLASVERRIEIAERALSFMQRQQAPEYRIDNVRKCLDRLNADKRELSARRDHWQRR